MAVRHLDLECGSDKEGIRAVALSPRRDVLAIARPNSLRLYRIVP